MTPVIHQVETHPTFQQTELREVGWVSTWWITGVYRGLDDLLEFCRGISSSPIEVAFRSSGSR